MNIDLPALPVSHYEYQIPLATSPCNNKLAQEKKTHLILHLDLNKTIIATDKAANLDSDTVLVYSLASHTFDRWGEDIPEPISFTEYVKFFKVPNPTNDKAIKKEQYKEISHFLTYLKERNHPAYEKTRKKFLLAKQKLQDLQSAVFPSFFSMINHLEKENIPYTLIIRTFGTDGPEAAREINEVVGYPLIRSSYTMKEGMIQTDQGEIDLHSFITTHKEHCLIRDDWMWWFSHGENSRYGKPFPLYESKDILSIFFDDHAQVLYSSPEKNIVAATTEKGEFIHPTTLIEEHLLYPVDTIEALIDDHYFIKKINHSLESHLD